MFEFEDMEYPKELDAPMNILPYIIPVEMYIDKEIAGCYSISVLFRMCVGAGVWITVDCEKWKGFICWSR